MQKENYLKKWRTGTTILLFITALSVTGCDVEQLREAVRPPDSGENTDDNDADAVKLPEISAAYGSMIEVPNSDWVLIPAGLTKRGKSWNFLESVSKSRSDYGDVSDTYANGYREPYSYNGECINMIFCHLEDGSSRVFSNEKQLISRVYYPVKTDSLPNNHKDHFFFEMRTVDWNEDKKLDQKDPVSLYIADSAGRNPIGLGPDGHALVSWKIRHDHSMILLTLREDTDKNKRFNNLDALKFYKIDPKDPTNATELISEGTNSQLQTLTADLWGEKKEKKEEKGETP